MDGDLKGRTVNGLFWSFFSQGGRLGCQFIVVAVLARLLSSETFGLLATAIVLTGFGNIFVEMGIGVALIQKQDATLEHYDSFFWLNVGAGAFMTVLIVAIAPLMAGFYKQPHLQPVVMALSISYFFTSLVVVQQALLMKEMKFKQLAARDLGATIFSGVVGIVLAWQGFGVWSLVAQELVFSSFNAVLTWALSSWHPRFYFSSERVREVSHFSTHLIGFDILNYCARNVDKLIVGRFLGMEALGYYSLAYRIVLFPLQNIAWAISRVMFPVLSMIQHDLARVADIYVRMIGTIAFVVVPLMMGVFICAPEIVRIFLGEKWLPMIPLLRIFVLCGIFQSIGTTVGNIYLSQGKADRQFNLQTVGTLIVTVSVGAGLRWGVVGVAAFYTVQAMAWVIINLWMVSRLIKCNFRLFWDSLCPHFLMAGFLSLLAFPSGSGISTWDFLLLKMGLVAALFLGVAVVTKQVVCDSGRFYIKDF